uniref:Uncharacterized protein n=1 Tax=Arundo donax TaxID=35708 RepID=A0A0A9BLF7_ARUDO
MKLVVNCELCSVACQQVLNDSFVSYVR